MSDTPDIRRARWVRIVSEGPDGSTVTDPLGGGEAAVIGDPISDVALTVADSVVDLTDVAGGIPATAKWARVEAQCAWAPKEYSDPDLTVEVSDRIRYRYAGTAPTATAGFFLTDGDPLVIPEELLESFQFILDGEASAATASLFVTFHE